MKPANNGGPEAASPLDAIAVLLDGAGVPAHPDITHRVTLLTERAAELAREVWHPAPTWRDSSFGRLYIVDGALEVVLKPGGATFFNGYHPSVKVIPRPGQTFDESCEPDVEAAYRAIRALLRWAS